MRVCADRKDRCSRGGLALLLVVALALPARLGSGRVDGGAGDLAAGGWKVGQPSVVAVEQGRARVVVPTPSTGSRVLVIASALSREAGPFSARLEARPTTRALTPFTPLPEPEPSRPRPPQPEPLPPPALGLPAPVRTFHVLARRGDPTDARHYRAVEAHLRALGRWVQVYVGREDLARVAPETLRDLIAEFEERVLPVSCRWFGPAADVDQDGRFTVLLTSQIGGHEAGPLAPDAYVRGADFDPDLPAPFGNRCDMMYLGAHVEAGAYLRTLLAHEYTHAVTFSRKVADARALGGPPRDEEGWLDEAIAHLVEDLHGQSRANLDYRVSAFLSAPERYRLLVEDYYTSDLFRSHGHRGSTYRFLRWCVDRHGPGLLPALVRSGERGLANLEAATGSRFVDLYRLWSIRVYFDGASEPLATPDGWLLAGPRPARIEPGGPPGAWSSAGTATHYAIVSGSDTGAVEIDLTASAGGDWQMTAVLLPEDLPELDLDARLAREANGAYRLDLDVRERGGQPARLEAVGWERLIPANGPLGPGFRRGGLSGPTLVAAFGGVDLPANGRRSARGIALPGVSGADGPLVLKLVARDAEGRRVVAWAEVDPLGVEPDTAR